MNWLKQRFPLEKIWRENFTHYLLPKNLNIWYVFGMLSLFLLVNQLLSGIWLTMYYIPTADQAFSSIQHLMRDVPYGWLFRYLHVVGATALFSVIYLHMLRSLLYGSYQAPRELVWIIGMLLYLLLIVEAFTGALLPWGQLSYWGAQVVTSLFSVLPGGEQLVTWLRGDYQVSEITLRRFFALHIIAIPLLIFIVSRWHIMALHHVGANNPTGVATKNQIAFHPFYTFQDLIALLVFLLLFFGMVCFMPHIGGFALDPVNAIQANPMHTPTDIAPHWYLVPFYAMLRVIPNKFLGVMTVLVAFVGLFLLPWLDKTTVRAIRHRNLFSKLILCLFVLSFVVLIYLGRQTLTPTILSMTRICIAVYFSFFILLPISSKLE